MIYNLIGRAVVKLGWIFVKKKAGANAALLTGVGVAAGLTAITVAGYLITRDAPEA